MTSRHAIVVGFLLITSHLPIHAGPRESARYDVLGTYLNEGRSLIEVELITRDGREATTIPLSPGRIDRALIRDGKTMIYTPSDESGNRRLIYTIATPTPRTAPQFFERSTRTFYFRIIAGKISLVRPRDLTAAERNRLRAYFRELKTAGVHHTNEI